MAHGTEDPSSHPVILSLLQLEWTIKLEKATAQGTIGPMRRDLEIHVLYLCVWA